MKNTYLKKFLTFILILSMATSLFLFAPAVSYGAQLRPGAADIPSGTLIIGTHLIHIKALNSELLAVATASATSSLQAKTYYKSEFSNGTWYDISGASGFSDITSEGKPVANTVIDALILTHWTREDGKTIDLATGMIVDIHKINDPSDFSTLPELAELKTRRNMLIETIKNENTGENNQKLQSIERIIITPFSSEESKAVIDKMDALEKYINYLKEKKTRDDWVNAVVDLKGSMNTGKTLLCYKEVLSRLNTEISFVETKIVDADNKTKPAADLSAAYYTCLDAVNKKIVELEGSQSGSQGTGALNKAKAGYEEAVIASAIAASYDKADSSLEKCMSVKNILGGLKLDIPLELSILKPLLSDLTKELCAACTGGISSEYTQAKKTGESAIILDSLKKKHVSGLSSQVSDIESIIGYIKDRESDALQLETVLSPVLKSCLDALSKVPVDDARDDTVDVLKQLIDWLNAELALLQQQQMDTTLSDSLSSLESQISELTQDYLSALDERNLSGAQSIKAEIDELAAKKADIYENAAAEQSKLFEQKAALEAKLEDALNKGDSAAASDLLNQLSTINAALDIQDSATDGLTAVNNAAVSDLFTELEEYLSQSDFTSALSKMQEISDMLNASKPIPANSLSLLNKILPKVQSKLEDAETKGKTTDAGKLTKIETLFNSLLGIVSNEDSQIEADTDALQDALLEKLDSLILQSGIDSDTADGQLLKALLLDKLGETPEFSALGDFIKTLQEDALAQLKALGSDYTVDDYKILNGQGYANLKELAAISGRRYVWQQSSGTASVTSGRSAIIFSKNSSSVTIDKKLTSMPLSTHFSSSKLYVPLSFTADALNSSWIRAGLSGKPLIYPKKLDKVAAGLMK